MIHGHESVLVPRLAEAETLVDIVRRRAVLRPGAIAYSFLADGAADVRSIAWSELDRRASAIAAALIERRAAGERVLLALPSGLAFVESLLGCWYAGAIAVPISVPRHHRVKHRLDGIIADADARFAIGTPDASQRLGLDGPGARGMTWIDVDSMPSDAPTECRPSTVQEVAMLQYTSGSTGSPRGVVLTHANLVSNSALITEACGLGPDQVLGGWLPLFHDMGLIGGVVQAAYCGARCVFMSPERFLMRPVQWLQMISDYRICSSPAPNFAYDLCVDKVDEGQKSRLDLSSWRNALNGSEPVRASTLDRFSRAFASCGFSPDAFFPCYGLAEATLFVTGPKSPRRQTRRSGTGQLLDIGDATGHVGCGTGFGDTRLAIVDPETCVRVSPGRIGEIWAAGQSIAKGYWRNPEATEATFNGRLAGLVDGVSPSAAWLRTGDLGFVDEDGALFITGRLRDLIIVAGKNHFPIDLERTVETEEPAVGASGCAAVSVDIGGAERLVIIAEVRRELCRPGAPIAFDPEAVRRNIRAAIVREHQVAPHDVVLLRPGALLRTSSGKISRRPIHDAYLKNTLELLVDSTHVRTKS